jgi:hypothetical protein
MDGLFTAAMLEELRLEERVRETAGMGIRGSFGDRQLTHN